MSNKEKKDNSGIDRRFHYYGIEEIRPGRYCAMKYIPGDEGPIRLSHECYTFGEVYLELNKAIREEYKRWWE